MIELLLSKAFVLLAHLAMFNLVAVPVLMVLVISLVFSVLMFNLCMLDEKLFICYTSISNCCGKAIKC